MSVGARNGVRSVACPKCGASAGTSCVTRAMRGGRGTYGELAMIAHRERWDVFNRLPVSRNKIPLMKDKSKKVRLGYKRHLAAYCAQGTHNVCWSRHCTCECHTRGL